MLKFTERRKCLPVCDGDTLINYKMVLCTSVQGMHSCKEKADKKKTIIPTSNDSTVITVLLTNS